MTYGAYARVYDRIGQSRLSLRLAPRAYATAAAALGRKPRAVLDLCCGTGSAAAWFAAQGCRTVGVDRSEDMLRLAQSKAPQVTWIRQDMRQLDAGTGFDLVTCLYDSVNYLLTEADLLGMAAGVYRALAPGGLFLFDYNTAYRYATRFDNQTIVAADEPDIFGIYRTDWDPEPRICRTQAVFFCREADDSWSRFEEEHRFRGWHDDEWESALRRAGFADVQLGRMAPRRRVDDFRLWPVQPHTGRVVVLARK